MAKHAGLMRALKDGYENNPHNLRSIALVVLETGCI